MHCGCRTGDEGTGGLFAPQMSRRLDLLGRNPGDLFHILRRELLDIGLKLVKAQGPFRTEVSVIAAIAQHDMSDAQRQGPVGAGA